MDENKKKYLEILYKYKTKLAVVFLFVLLVIIGYWSFGIFFKKQSGNIPPVTIDQSVSAMVGEITEWNKGKLVLKNDQDGQIYNFSLNEDIPLTRLSSYNQNFENSDWKSVVVGTKINLIYRRENDQIKVLSAVLMPEFSIIASVKSMEGNKIVTVANEKMWEIFIDDTTNIITQDEHNLRVEKLPIDKIKIGDLLAVTGRNIDNLKVQATKLEIIPNNNKEIKQ